MECKPFTKSSELPNPLERLGAHPCHNVHAHDHVDRIRDLGYRALRKVTRGGPII